MSSRNLKDLHRWTEEQNKKEQVSERTPKFSLTGANDDTQLPLWFRFNVLGWTAGHQMRWLLGLGVKKSCHGPRSPPSFGPTSKPKTCWCAPSIFILLHWLWCWNLHSEHRHTKLHALHLSCCHCVGTTLKQGMTAFCPTYKALWTATHASQSASLCTQQWLDHTASALLHISHVATVFFLDQCVIACRILLTSVRCSAMTCWKVWLVRTSFWHLVGRSTLVSTYSNKKWCTFQHRHHVRPWGVHVRER